MDSFLLSTHIHIFDILSMSVNYMHNLKIYMIKFSLPIAIKIVYVSTTKYKMLIA